MNNQEILEWLMQGDVSIQYQTSRDLLNKDCNDLQKRIEKEGWGAQFLSKRHPDGHWGEAFYQPKWISSHYTLLDLRNLCIDPGNGLIRESINNIIEKEKAPDGGIKPIGESKASDVCINGMFLNYASYFQTQESDLHSVVDCLLSQVMPDGGFNCQSNRSGARHSSLHSTISVLEGIEEFLKQGCQYRIKDLKHAKKTSIEFILLHQLFKSDHTGEIIHKDFLRLSYPGRWKYDILRAMDYFQYAKVHWVPRMQAALNVLLEKRNKDGTWNLQAKHPGQVHFEMEKAGKPSRWNTLRAMRVLKHFDFQR